MPAVGFKTLGNVFIKSQIGITFDGDVVIVVKINHVSQTEMAGERGSFRGDAFHHITVAADGVNFIIENFKIRLIVACCHILLRDRHSNTIRKTLSQRSGCDFNSWCQAVFRVAGRNAVKLTEIFNVI